MAVENAVYLNDFKERMAFPISNVAFIRADRPDELRVVLRHPVSADFVIAGDEDLARIPAFAMTLTQAGNLCFHRKTEPLERFVAGIDIICVSGAFKRRRTGLLMAVKTMMIPMVPEMYDDIGPIFNNGLCNPVEMIDRNAGPYLRIAYDEVPSRLPLHAATAAFRRATAG